MKILLVEGKKDSIVIRALCRKNGINVEETSKLDNPTPIENDGKNGINVEETSKLDNPTPVENDGKNISFYVYLDPKKTNNDDNALKHIKSVFNLDALQAVGIVLDADKPETDAKIPGISQQVLSRLEAIQYKLNTLENESQKNFYKEKIFEGKKKTSKKNLENGIVVEGNSEFPRFGVWLMPDNRNPGMLENFLIELAENEKCIEFAQQCVESAKQQEYASFKPTHKSKAIIHTYLAWQHEPGDTLELIINNKKYLDTENELANRFINWLKNLFEIK